MAHPGYARSAASITGASVESTQSGASTASASFFTRRRIWLASSVRSVKARHTSSVWAPPSTWLRAIGTSSSSRSSSASCFTLREPCVLSRSPIIIGAGSWRSATAVIPLETIQAPRPGRGAGARDPTAAARARVCSGVVPQQPPTMFTPCSTTNSRRISAIGSACIGYTARPPSLIGRPAFGMQWIGTLAFWDR